VLPGVSGYFYFIPLVIVLIYGAKFVFSLLYTSVEAWTLIWKTMKREVKDSLLNKREIRVAKAFDNTAWRENFIRDMATQEMSLLKNPTSEPLFYLVKTMGTWKESITMIAFYMMYVVSVNLSIDTAMKTISRKMTENEGEEGDKEEVRENTETPFKRILFLSEKLLKIMAYAFPSTLACVVATWLVYTLFYHLRYKAVEYLIKNLYILSIPLQIGTQFLVRSLYGFYANTIDTVDLELFRPDWKSSFQHLYTFPIPLVLITFVCGYLMMLSVMVWLESDAKAYQRYNVFQQNSDAIVRIKSELETYTQITKAMLLLSSILFGALLILRNFKLDRVFYISAIFMIASLATCFLVVLFLFV